MKFFVNGFAIWLLIVTVIALLYPPAFSWYNLDWINPMLGVIMLSMGLTLTWEDFARVGKEPKSILMGVLLQYTIMPAAGYLVAWLFALETPFAVGLILVACCPGGTASNVVSYIARADVALSVSMTMLSTLAAVLATPFLTAWLVGNRVEVDPIKLLLGTAYVVLIPVIAGVSIRRFLPTFADILLPVAPAIAVAFVVLIVAGITSYLQEAILKNGLSLIAAVGLVHVLGFGLGYGVGRLFSHREQVGRTVSLEVGMQNAGLGISLANVKGAFASPLLVALPCAFSGLASCLLGSLLAAIWSRLPAKEKAKTPTYE